MTAEALKDVNFDVIYSSPLIRAYKTAEIIRGDRNINIITDDRLKEMSFGIYEGLPSNEVPADFADFFAAPDKFKAMEGGESFQDVIARTASFIEDVIVPASDSISTMLVVAHGALNNALAFNLLPVSYTHLFYGYWHDYRAIHRKCVLERVHYTWTVDNRIQSVYELPRQKTLIFC